MTPNVAVSRYLRLSGAGTQRDEEEKLTTSKYPPAEGAAQASALDERPESHSRPTGREIGSAPDDEAEHALQRACAAYWAANLELDRLLSGDADPVDSVGMLLHRKWFQSLLRVLSLPAATVEGERSKSAILRNAFEVALGQSVDQSLGSEQLGSLLWPELHP